MRETREIIKLNISRFEVAPIRSIFFLIMMIPIFSFNAWLLTYILGSFLSMILTLVSEGLVGLAGDNWVFEGTINDIADFCLIPFNIMTPVKSLVFKVLLMIPYMLIGYYLFESIDKELDSKNK